MKTLWGILKTLTTAIIIAFSIEKGFSYGDLLNITNNKGNWIFNIGVHTAIISIFFLFLEWIFKKNSVIIDSYLYSDKEDKENSDYIVLKIDDLNNSKPKEIYWYIKITGKRYMLPKYLKLCYTNDLTLQISRKGRKYIVVNDEKNYIKVRLREFLSRNSDVEGQIKELPISIVLDEENFYEDSYFIRPKCFKFSPFIKLKTKKFKVRVKEA